MEKEFLSASDLAALFGVTRHTVYRWLRDGVFRPVKIGGKTFVHKSEVDRIVSGARDGE